MATVNFPSSPALNDEYAYGGFTYVWDGEKWTSKATTNTAFVKTTGDTMTGDLEVPMVYLQSGQVNAPNATTRKDYVDGNFMPSNNYAYNNRGGIIIRNETNAPGYSLSMEVGDSGIRYIAVDGAYQAMSFKTSAENAGIAPAVTIHGIPHSDAAQGTGNTALTRKDYVDDRVNNSVYNTGTGFDQTVDWNNFATPGVWRFGSTDGTSFGPNGPSESGYAYGTLVVFVGATGVTQCYYPHMLGAKPAERTSFDSSSSFTPWRYTYHTSAPPTALEVGAASTDRVNELETRLTQLEALVATLTGGA